LQVQQSIGPLGGIHVYLKTDSISVPGVALPLAKPGQLNAAVATTNALHFWDPEVTLLVGMAGGFERAGVSPGDVLVATEIVDFEHQKVNDAGAEVRLRSFVASKELVAAAVATSTQDWMGKLPRMPRVHFGPLLSGEKIVASDAFANRLQSWRPDSLGIEMEGSGVATATSCSKSKLLMIRGVADLANHTKSDSFQAAATEAAAEFAKAVLCEWFSPTVARQEA
jgi:nucleoside phosphorylase